MHSVFSIEGQLIIFNKIPGNITNRIGTITFYFIVCCHTHFRLVETITVLIVPVIEFPTAPNTESIMTMVAKVII